MPTGTVKNPKDHTGYQTGKVEEDGTNKKFKFVQDLSHNSKVTDNEHVSFTLLDFSGENPTLLGEKVAVDLEPDP